MFGSFNYKNDLTQLNAAAKSLILDLFYILRCQATKVRFLCTKMGRTHVCNWRLIVENDIGWRYAHKFMENFYHQA